MKKIALSICSLLLGIALVATLAGCEGGNATTFNPSTSNLTPNTGGGGVNGSGTTRRGGRATLTIRWPERTQATRLIPQAAESIVVTLSGVLDSMGNPTLSGPDPAPQTLTRPNPGDPLVTTATFDNLELGDYVATATAYAVPFPDPAPLGPDVALATATTTVTIPDFTEGIPTIRLTLASTAVNAQLIQGPSPNPFPFLLLGQTNQLEFTLLDSTGALVLFAPAQITYTSDNPAAATVDATTGLVTAVADGTTNITATDSESGLSAVVSVTVFVADRVEFRNTPIDPFAVGSIFTLDTVLVNAAGSIELPVSLPYATIAYTNSDPAVATLNPTTRLVRGVSAGTTNIRATVTFNGTMYQTPVFTLDVVP